VGVFVIEKLAYVTVWLTFITSRSLSSVYELDMLAGIFYTIYGANDFIFMLFFSFVFLNQRQERWLGKTAQRDKWIFCLMAARAAA